MVPRQNVSAATVQGNKTLQAANTSRHAESNFSSSVGGSKILGLPSERNEHSRKAEAELTLDYQAQLYF